MDLEITTGIDASSLMWSDQILLRKGCLKKLTPDQPLVQIEKN
jgi:hypothetical protein